MVTPLYTVLVVDDDPLGIEMIEEHLGQAHCRVITAGDGEEAWTQLQRLVPHPDVVLTDRIMPRLSGLELLQRIKGDADLAAIPVIMVTSAADREDVIEGIDAGAYYYLTKPVDRDILLSMVRAAVSDYSRFKELQREVRSDAGTLVLLEQAVFRFRTPDEGTNLGTFLAKACPDPRRVVLGLSELLVNAIEHGNLEISYGEKTELTRSSRLQQEIRARLDQVRYRDRRAHVRFERGDDEIIITIRDEGPGFDPTPYLRIDPQRVFDSHGRGIAIAKLMSFDSLEYRNGGREVEGRLVVASHDVASHG